MSSIGFFFLFVLILSVWWIEVKIFRLWADQDSQFLDVPLPLWLNLSFGALAAVLVTCAVYALGHVF